MATGNGEHKKFSPWESILWHFQSRRSRAALVAIIGCVILNHPKLREFFGVDEKTAATFANQLIILAGIVIAALTGEKFVPNGNGKVDPEKVTSTVLGKVKDEITDKLNEELSEKIDKLDPKKYPKDLLELVKKELVDKVDEKLSERVTKLEEEAHALLDKLEDKVNG